MIVHDIYSHIIAEKFTTYRFKGHIAMLLSVTLSLS